MSSFKDRQSARKTIVDRRTHRHKAIEALRTQGFHDIASQLKNCGPRNYCGSQYCSDCRKRLVACQTEKVLGVHQDLYGDDEAKGRQNTYFVTILNELCELEAGQIRDALSRGKRSLASLRRSFEGLLTYGRFELEAIDTDVIFRHRPCPKKAIVLKHLNGDSEETPARVMGLFHLHALMFLNDHDAKVVRRKLSAMYPGNHRVELRPLHVDKPVDESLRKIVSYFLKSRVQFNYVMKTDGYQGGRLIDNDSLSRLVCFGLSNEIGVSSCNVYCKR